MNREQEALICELAENSALSQQIRNTLASIGRSWRNKKIILNADDGTPVRFTGKIRWDAEQVETYIGIIHCYELKGWNTTRGSHISIPFDSPNFDKVESITFLKDKMDPAPAPF